MDDSTTLISELLNKLAELDQKVCDYRQDMASEFERYSHNLLRDAPSHISARVEEALADELHNYSALRPALARLNVASAGLGRSSIGSRTRRGRASPPPVLPHTSGVPPNDGSPPDRNREREFHGLFTPRFLPLLEVMQPIQPRSTPAAISSPATSRDNESNQTQEPSPPVQIDNAVGHPDRVSHYPEEAVASLTLDDIVLPTRRSALRRSSSGSTKDTQSPRRVRFDVEGEEVLPTVSPPISPRLHDLLTSPPPEDQAAPIRESSDYIVLEEDVSVFGNSPPRPKKISSTERLKALARSSTEDTSKWTVVGDIHDDEEDEGLVIAGSRKKTIAFVPEPAPVTRLQTGADSHYTEDELAKTRTTEPNDKDDTGETADDILELTPLASFRDKKKFSHEAHETIPEAKVDENSTLQQKLPGKTKQPSPNPSPRPSNGLSLEEEDLFSFDDDDEPSLQLRATKVDDKYVEEDETETETQITPFADESAEDQPVSLYSTSPAIPFAKSGSSASKQTGTSVGSYKGKPFIIGVVRDEELHKQAAEMGDIPTFVGSVDGRSGMDPSDSFHRASYYFNGTSGSIGERLMGEAHARRTTNDPWEQE
ncbi:hypothetical protein F5Y14DRAFT_367203 [Nemania sp. NC0429]|nr:hypothetical protein F5Y14DRAFT_367203 [Nemania sp. NC0429]